MTPVVNSPLLSFLPLESVRTFLSMIVAMIRKRPTTRVVAPPASISRTARRTVRGISASSGTLPVSFFSRPARVAVPSPGDVFNMGCPNVAR